MSNGDDNENGKKKLIGLISKQNNFVRAAHFFVHFFAVVLHDYNVKPHSKLHGLEKVVCAHQKFCCLCSCFHFFFHCHSVSPCWPLFIFSPAATMKFPCCLSLFRFISRSSSFSVFDVSGV